MKTEDRVGLGSANRGIPYLSPLRVVYLDVDRAWGFAVFLRFLLLLTTQTEPERDTDARSRGSHVCRPRGQPGQYEPSAVSMPCLSRPLYPQ